MATSKKPSNRALPVRRDGQRSTARSDLSSASVSASTSHGRPANSGREAMSVVLASSLSWRSTTTPSAVSTRSGSTASTPCAIARRYDAMVCSGR